MEFYCFLPVSVLEEVFEGKHSLTAQECGQALCRTHESFIAEVDRLPPDLLTYVLPGKWSAAQQLAHLAICLEAVAKALHLEEGLAGKFGTINRPLLDSMGLVRLYRDQLQGGGKAPERFIPAPVTDSEKAGWIARLRAVLQDVSQAIIRFDEAALDRLAMPHPFLGLLSVREMMYLMIFHAPHHLAQVRYQLDQKEKQLHLPSN